MKKTLFGLLSFLGLALLPAAPAQGQTASLVADLAVDGAGSSPSSYPGRFFAFQGKVFFFGTDQGSGEEMWVSDGTPQGTEMLVDACPGPCGSPRGELLGTANGRVFWIDEDDRLWSSDGTRAGTQLLAGPGDLSLSGENFAFAGPFLYFTGCTDDETACGLWRSDGTPAGTQRVLEITDRGVYSVGALTAFGGKLYFPAQSEHDDSELWVSDGTAAGTRALRSFSRNVAPRRLTVAGGKLFFTAGETLAESSPEELWVSDGTAAGTRVVSRFESRHPFVRDWLKALGNQVYFLADDVTHGVEIWKSDGTAEGTARVTDFGVERPFYESTTPAHFVLAGGRLVFLANDGLTSNDLWAVSGAPAAAPVPLADLCATGCTYQPDPSLVSAGGRVLFAADDADHGIEVWSTDGTPAGTRLTRDVCPGRCSSLAGSFGSGRSGILVPLLGRAFWVATEDYGRYDEPETRQLNLWVSDGTAAGTRRWTELPLGAFVSQSEQVAAAIGQTVFFGASGTDAGYELWASDGRPGGTRLLADLARARVGSVPNELTAVDGRLFFTACTENSRRVWRSSGTGPTTAPVQEGAGFPCQQDWPSGPTRIQPAAAGGYLFFLRNDAQLQTQLWRTDGAAAGTVQLTSTPDGRVSGPPVTLGTRVFFPRQKGTAEAPVYELWRSDGTVPGTGLAVTLPTGWVLSRLAAFNGALFFVLENTAGERQLWRSDGTQAGSRALQTFDFVEPAMAQAGSHLFFFAGASGELSSLWKTDGTPAGTVPVLRVDETSHPIVEAVGHQGAFYFVLRSYGRVTLWKSDGTAAGTVRFATFEPEIDASRLPPTPLVPAGGGLYFPMDDGVHGIELWRTDGTAAGTAMVRDLFPGPVGSRPAGLAAAAGALYFSASDGVHGVELWKSDGTAAGTRLVHDIHPGSLSSSPEQLVAAGGRLFFSADDGLAGRELWALPLDAAPACVPSSTRLCLNGGRFAVEARWRDFASRTGQGTAVPLTADTGYFWFFGPDNVEVVIKVLDGRTDNGHHWVFYGALSDVEYTLTVTDTQTGATARYSNPAGQFASVGDVTGFGRLGAFSSKRIEKTAPPSLPVLVAERFDPAAIAPCQAGPARLCLNGGRFAVEAVWKALGRTGAATAVPLTADTGYFWFFGPDNVEVVVKVLDGRGHNGHFWVFYGALSDVEYTLTVTDTQTGKVKTYANPKGRFASIGDTGAF